NKAARLWWETPCRPVPLPVRAPPCRPGQARRAATRPTNWLHTGARAPHIRASTPKYADCQETETAGCRAQTPASAAALPTFCRSSQAAKTGRAAALPHCPLQTRTVAPLWLAAATSQDQHARTPHCGRGSTARGYGHHPDPPDEYCLPCRSHRRSTKPVYPAWTTAGCTLIQYGDGRAPAMAPNAAGCPN